MSAPASSYGHVLLDARGHARVGRSAMTVVQLVAEQAAHGWSPEELHFQHPDLTLAEIHSALAYYWDHAREIDAEIEEQLREVDSRRASQTSSPLLQRLRDHGLL